MDGGSRSLEDVAASMRRFGSDDYAVFGAMLVGCSAVGVYFGWMGHRKDARSEASDYLMGGRNMQVFPVGEHLHVTFEPIEINPIPPQRCLWLPALYRASLSSALAQKSISTDTQYCFIFIAIFASAVGMY